MIPPDRASAPPGQAPATLPSVAERERVVQALSTHFANDRLSMDEFEDRLERAYKAVATPQLAALLADLPALDAADAAARAPAFLAPPGEVPARGVMIAVLGASERKGSWIVPRRLKVFAFMGGAELDLREARFAPGVTEIDVTAIMGGVEIIVPPGVRVESFGAAFMGGFDAHAGDAAALSALNPVIRLSGIAIMGGVEAKTRALGERKGRGRRRRSRDDASQLPDERDR
jgi:hypothetical protein